MRSALVFVRQSSIGERGNRHALPFSAEARFACLALCLLVSGCPGDDNAEAASSDAGMDAGPERNDASSPDASDGGLDASRDADASDAALDSGEEVDAATSISPLALCAALDSRWGIDASGDRPPTWGNDIMLAFVTRYSADCRLNQIVSTLPEQSQVDYVNFLIAWTLQFFGCAAPSTEAGALTYGLTQSSGDTVFSSAEAATLSGFYVEGLAQAISDVGGEALPEATLLEVRMRLDQLADAAPEVIPSEGYPHDACAETQQ